MKDEVEPVNSRKGMVLFLGFMTCAAVGLVLRVTAPVILPVTLALFLAMAIHPLVVLLQRWYLPRIVSIFLAIGIILLGLYLVGVVLFSSARTIVAVYPRYERRLTDIYVSLAGFFEFSYDQRLSFLDNLWSQWGVRSKIRDITLSLSNGLITLLREALMVVLIMAFVLLETAFFKDKIDLAFEHKRSGQLKKILADVVRQISRYLSAKFFISLATGMAVTIGLSLTGLEFAVIWGLLQFALNFIPNIGSIAVGAGAGLFALLQFWPDPAPIIATVLIMLGINMIIGNILEPKIMGDNLGIAPIAVLLSLMIWGWLWGFAGLILAVPMTVIVKILCENIPMLEPVSILLGSRKAVLAKKAEIQVNCTGGGHDKG
ncbi:MAG: AI-2E family transporter [Spirochaetaceae bacterium]|jgi:predicted PurR-regulated permease PerM|nr:AI-2E family transporter [Spirochaetaceae bacterium]